MVDIIILKLIAIKQIIKLLWLKKAQNKCAGYYKTKKWLDWNFKNCKHKNYDDKLSVKTKVNKNIKWLEYQVQCHLNNWLDNSD